MAFGGFKGSNLKIRQQTWHRPPLGEILYIRTTQQFQQNFIYLNAKISEIEL